MFVILTSLFEFVKSHIIVGFDILEHIGKLARIKRLEKLIVILFITVVGVIFNFNEFSASINEELNWTVKLTFPDVIVGDTIESIPPIIVDPWAIITLKGSINLVGGFVIPKIVYWSTRNGYPVFVL